MRPLFGSFHSAALLCSVLLPVCFAYLLKDMRKRLLLRILFACGVVLALSECYKQYYFFFRIHDRAFDPWIVPFQVCSVPMYLCLVLPLVRGRGQETVLTYLWDYTFFGALLALLYPEDILNRPLPMALHGFSWHATLLFIAFLVLFSGMADDTRRSYFRATALFLLFCGVALLLNVLLEETGTAGTYPDLFYLTPFHLTMQPVAHTVELTFGRPPARILYVLALVLLGALDHMILTATKKMRSFR